MGYNRKITVAAGHYHQTHRAGSWVARQKGWFAQEGLDVEITATGNDERTLESLMEGSIDIGLDVRSDKAVRANAQGLPVYIVGVWRNTPRSVLFVKKEITRVEDLRGKRIGLNSSKGGIRYKHICNALRRHGLNPDTDVTWVQLDSPLASIPHVLADMASGATDVGEAQFNRIPEFLAAGYHVLLDFRNLYPQGYVDRVMVTSKRVIDEHPEAIKAFLKGVMRGHRFVTRPENFAAVREYLNQIYEDDIAKGGEFEKGAKKDPLNQSVDEEDDLAMAPYSMDTRVDPRALQVVIDLEKAVGEIPASISVEQVLRPQFADEAAREVREKYGPEGY